MIAHHFKKAVFTRATPQIRRKSPKSPNGPIFSALFPDEARLKENGPPQKVSCNENQFFDSWLFLFGCLMHCHSNRKALLENDYFNHKILTVFRL